MNFPVYLHVGVLKIPAHFILEVLAYGAGFRFYLWLRRRGRDPLDDTNRWWTIAAAVMGAAIGSRILYWFEDPRLTLANWHNPAFLFGGKTIVGALVGGLFAVEWTKRRLGITCKTGDLFTLPLCLGIAIGRIGCFLEGLDDHTAGKATSVPWAVNFGDGIGRHPTQLYESIFILVLGLFLWRRIKSPFLEGDIFKLFMVGYFTFRLFCDFLKPDVRVFMSMSSIQWACLIMLLYFAPHVPRLLGYGTNSKQQISRVTAFNDEITPISYPR